VPGLVVAAAPSAPAGGVAFGAVSVAAGMVGGAAYCPFAPSA
jgi:hypothetical protein